MKAGAVELMHKVTRMAQKQQSSVSGELLSDFQSR
jgi:hypothetical protein